MSKAHHINKEKVGISIVSYTNTLPFRVGIETSPLFQQLADITYDYPARCAHKLMHGQVDLGLVPVAILPELDNYHVVGDYCIGAYGKVDTVKLYGEVPMKEMDTILLDYQSRTSVKLVQVLAKNYWHIAPQFTEGKPGFETRDVYGSQGAVVIGDRCFNLKGKYPYEYDLSQQWYHFTGLPFVFAAWVSRKPMDDLFEQKFNQALEQGVERVEEIADQYKEQVGSEVDLHEYLTSRVNYQFDVKKRKALELFLDFVKNL